MTTPGSFELGTDGPSALVVGIDGSATAWRALYYALGQARRQCSTVLAVFAISIAGEDSAGAAHDANIQLAQQLTPVIQELSVEFQVPIEVIRCAGDPVIILTNIAKTRHADGLILGASQALGHRIFGSKAVRAVRHCRCPVTVVP